MGLSIGMDHGHLSQEELAALHKLLTNLALGVNPSLSLSHGALVLIIQKKDRSLGFVSISEAQPNF